MLDFLVIFGGAIAIVVILVIVANLIPHQKETKYTGYKFLTGGTYVGGYDNLLDIIHVLFLEKDNSFFIELDEKHNKRKIEIPYKDIVKVEGKNEQQISNEPTLVNLLVFGVLAFGIQKQKISNRKFFILTYLNRETNEEQKVIFECNQAEKYVDMFNEKIRANYINGSKCYEQFN